MKRVTDQTMNGPLNKRHTNIVPKGLRTYQIREMRCWILIPKDATEKQAKEHARAYVEKYNQDLAKSIRKVIIT